MRAVRSPAALAVTRARGAALAVGLILLLLLTLLAVAGLRGSRLDLQRGVGALYASNALQAAERAIELALGSTLPTTTTRVVRIAMRPVGATGDSYGYRLRFDQANGLSAVPGEGFSLGAGVGFTAVHFDVAATGAAAGRATVTATQSYYVVGPPGD